MFCPHGSVCVVETSFFTPRRSAMAITKSALKILRRQIERHRFLFIVDEVSTEAGFAVFDRRGGHNLGTWIESADSLRYLVKHGAEAWLVSAHNGQDQLAASAEEQRREQLTDLAIQWALANADEMNEVLEHEDGRGPTWSCGTR